MCNFDYWHPYQWANWLQFDHSVKKLLPAYIDSAAEGWKRWDRTRVDWEAVSVTAGQYSERNQQDREDCIFVYIGPRSLTMSTWLLVIWCSMGTDGIHQASIPLLPSHLFLIHWNCIFRGAALKGVGEGSCFVCSVKWDNCLGSKGVASSRWGAGLIEWGRDGISISDFVDC